MREVRHNRPGWLQWGNEAPKPLAQLPPIRPRAVHTRKVRVKEQAAQMLLLEQHERYAADQRKTS